MIYLVLFLCVVFFAVVEQTKGAKNLVPYLFYGSVIVLILLIGFRFETGPDYGSYMDIYVDPQDFTIEPLFKLWIYFFKNIHLNFNLFLLSVAFFSIYFKAYIMKKYAGYFFLSLLLALPVSFLGDMGQIRFSLAMSILWLSIPYCVERKLIPFLLIMFIAIMVHYSALVFLPIYWVCRLKPDVWVALGIWLCCYLASQIYMDMDIIKHLTNLVTENDAVLKLQTYVETDKEESRYLISFFNGASKVVILLLLYYSNIKNEDLKQFFYMVYFLGGCIFFLFSFSEILGGRFSLYFTSFEALFIPLIIYYTRNTKLHYILISVFLVRASYQFLYQIYIKNPETYLPYKSILKFL